MTPDEIVESLERIVYGGVAITSAALQYATDDQELTFTQWRAILVVGESADGMRVGAVAARLFASLPSTSRLLRRLEVRGFMTLERDETDRRATCARLTQAGSHLRSSVLAFRRRELARILEEAHPPLASHRGIDALAGRFEARGHGTPPPGQPDG